MTGEHACGEPAIPFVSGGIWAWIDTRPRVDWCTAAEAEHSHCPGDWVLMRTPVSTIQIAVLPTYERGSSFVFIDRTAGPWRWSCADGFGEADLPKVTTISWGWP